MIIKEKKIHFWNGNKSATRRNYEKQLLTLCLQEAGITDADIIVDECDYPVAEDEGNVFSNGCDLLVSVAGNQKFSGKPTTIIEIPVCRGVLGHRLLVIPQKQAEYFANINNIHQLQQMTIGIPATWADADLFRHNGFTVSEKGSLDELFMRLLDREFDYIALGANEIESIFEQFNGEKKGLLLEPTILIYYSLPLVFYIHPHRQDLVSIIKSGLTTAIANGKHESLFEEHHPDLINRLALRTRTAFRLTNPYLPSQLKNFRPKL
ncbi:MAG: hypothetical protein ACJAYN_000477 [Bermanella sp.]|jgi:hypothetical protein